MAALVDVRVPGFVPLTTSLEQELRELSHRSATTVLGESNGADVANLGDSVADSDGHPDGAEEREIRKIIPDECDVVRRNTVLVDDLMKRGELVPIRVLSDIVDAELLGAQSN